MNRDRRPARGPVLDVYLAPIPEGLPPGEIVSPERRRELEGTKNPAVLVQRSLAWRALEYAAARSFGLDARELRFHKNEYSRWSCEGLEFSLSHTEGMAAAAVSDSPVGVDVENIPLFAERYAAKNDLVAAMLRKVAAPREAGERGAAALLWLWTGKESLFKAGQSGYFQPDKTLCGAETRRLVILSEPPVLLAVSGAGLESLRLFLYRDGGAQPLDMGIVRDGREGLRGFFD